MCPVIVGGSREAIRVAVGRHVGAVVVSFISGLGSGANKTDFDDNSLVGGADDHNGKYIVLTSGTNDGEITRVSDYVVANTRVTVAPAVTANFAVNDTYEMWDEEFSPVNIEAFINQAIKDAYGRAYDPEESVALHTDGNQARFDIPSQFSMINKIEYRSSVGSKIIDLAGSAWTAGSNVTVSTDTKIKKRGTASNKLVLAAGVAAGAVVAYKDITAIDLSGMTHVEFWIRCTKTLVANDLKLLLDDTAGAVSPKETLGCPAITKDIWTFVRVALANPQDDTAIIAVGLEDDVDIGAETVWIDGVVAVDEDTSVWARLQPHLWKVDKQAQDLILTNAGRSVVGYTLLKLTGGDKPALLTADGDVNEIDDWYVEARATELALLSQNRMTEARYWHEMAREARASMPMLQNVREVI